MGQCSTLPAEARASSSVASRHEHNYQQSKTEQRHRLREDSPKQSLDFNKIVTPADAPEQRPPNQEDTKSTSSAKRKESKTETVEPPPSPQTRDQPNDPPADEPVDMDVDDREESAPPDPIPQPPESAIRTRCYKLNLDADIVGLSSSQRQQLCLGPFTEPPPYLTYSSSEDSTDGVDMTAVAIKTAQIFRGITISRDGTILSQNARATRSSRGQSKTKRGEKSRQAAKIDKAKDLVEETIATGKVPDSDEPAHMVSLVIVGEYDEMKQLVRDGSKKLRDADGLPDDALLSINRPRSQKGKFLHSSSTAASTKSPRKRASPNFVSSQRNAALQNSGKMQATGVPQPQPQSAPPKLKGHPRDTRPGSGNRREPRVRLDACHDFMDPRPVGAGDGDWSQAWNIWNCGGIGTTSPLQPSSPNENQGKTVFEGRQNERHSKPVFEGRESYGNTRESGVTSRAN